MSVSADPLSTPESQVPEPFSAAMSNLVCFTSVVCTSVIIFCVCHDLEISGSEHLGVHPKQSAALKFCIYQTEKYGYLEKRFPLKV